jgi:dTDP-glucose pyrophosphorylase
VCIGLPDTIWFPESGLALLPDGVLSLLLFPVDRPENFDAVMTDERDEVLEVQVKQTSATTHWVWGALKMPGYVLNDLHELWIKRHDEYLGTLINEYLARGGRAQGIRAGECYVDVGTLNGYREALRILNSNCVKIASA